MTFLLVVSGLLFGQAETGQVAGTVTDPQGAVVTNATVTVKNLNTAAVRSATTNENGLYTFTMLPPAPYEVTVEAQGFQALKKQVAVTVGSRNTLDLTLRVAGGEAIVEVVSASGGTQVEVTTQELSQVIGRQQIAELPTFNRNPYTLIGTAGNVTSDAQGSTIRGAGYSINGQRAASTDILLDGGENVDLFTASIGQLVPLDAVSEFRVITSNFSAEYGRASGGVVNVATRQGTNNFHGGVFWTYRGAGLTSNTYDNNAIMSVDHQGFVSDPIGHPTCANFGDADCAGYKPNYVRNQFGYSVGGPIWKDKLFFFNSTEWIRVRSSAVQQVVVPDPTFITSGAVAPETAAFFTAYGALRPGLKVVHNDVQVCGTSYDPVTDTCAVGNSVPFDTVAFTVPSNAGGGDPQNQYQTVARVDFNITEKTTMYGRYALQSLSLFPGSVSNSPYTGFDTGESIFNNNVLVNLTHIWNPNLVSQSKFIFNRLNDVQPINAAPTPTLFMRDRTTRIGGNRVALPGYLPFSPGSGIPFGGPQNLYQFYQDVSWNKGKHQFRFGGQYIHTRDNRMFGAYEESSQYLALTGEPSGMYIDRLIAGELVRFEGAVDPQGHYPCPTDPFGAVISSPACQVILPVSSPRFDRANRYHDFAAYAQDTWKIHPRLSLNLGMRWEYYGVQHSNDPSLDSNFYLGAGSTYPAMVRNGQVFPITDPGNPVGELWEPDWNNFAPRFGFAWDIFGDGKTSLRGGYGMAYERNFGNVTFNVIQNPPNYAVMSLTSGVDAVCIPTCMISVNNFGPLGAPLGVADLPKTSLRAPKQDLNTAYSHFWSLAIERELAKNTVLAVEYTGSKGVHLYSIENPNKIGAGVIYLGDNPADQFIPSVDCYGVGDCPTRRLNDQYSGFNRRGDAGFSQYHGLNVRLQTTNLFNSGWTFTSNYTWSHAIDNLSSTFSESANNFNLGFVDVFNPALDKGHADFDIRHRWVFSGVWDVPWFKNSDTWWGKYVLSGWTVSPVISVQSGTPFTLWDCTWGFQLCPRYMPLSAIDAAAHDANTLTDPTADQNSFSYITIDPTNTLNYFNPVMGTADFGDCGVGEGAVRTCLYPGQMTQRNAFRGPGLWNTDLAIAKNIKIGERFNLQFRADAFNLFNHSNLYVIGSTADVCNQLCFGDPASVTAKRGGFGDEFDERRYLSLGLKLTF